MSAFLLAWVLVAVVVSFVALALVVGLEVHEHRAKPAQARAPRIPAQRSAAVIVPVRDVEAFEEFLAELIVTPHVEAALS